MIQLIEILLRLFCTLNELKMLIYKPNYVASAKTVAKKCPRLVKVGCHNAPVRNAAALGPKSPNRMHANAERTSVL